MKRRFMTFTLAISIMCTPMTSLGHGGRTDGNGGHRDNKNASGLGYYHYHCGGYPPHLHTNGCPYSNKVSKSTSRISINKVLQTKLNQLGYNSGTVDGIIGKKTRAAVIRFQKARGLVVDGIAGKNTKKALGI